LILLVLNHSSLKGIVGAQAISISTVKPTAVRLSIDASMVEQCKSGSTTLRVPIINRELCHGEQRIQSNCADHENFAGELDSLSMILASVREW
jgi:hypothetical protein